MSAQPVGLTSSTKLVGPAVVLVAIGAVAVANFAGNGDNGGAGPFAISVAIIVLLGGYLFARAVPNSIAAGRPARLGLVLAALSIVALVAFWSGVPQVLAPAAIVLGLAAPRSGESVAAVALGSLAYAASLVGAVIG